MGVRAILQVTSASLSFISACDLIQFLSFPTHGARATTSTTIDDKLLYSIPEPFPWFAALLTDLALSLLFCIQHSLLKSSRLKWCIKDSLLRRFVYILTLYSVVLILKCYWEPIPEVILWDLSKYSPWSSNLIGFIHALSWYLIYASFLIMEWPDLSGAAPLNDDRVACCGSLNRFFKHYRHGSFIGFILILFVRSSMSLDRGLLALIWSSYMYMAWRPDNRDLEYQISMWELKKKDLDQL